MPVACITNAADAIATGSLGLRAPANTDGVVNGDTPTNTNDDVTDDISEQRP